MDFRDDITVDALLPLIDEYKGNVAAIARKLRVSRGTLYNRISDSPELQEALADARETMLDNAESKLYSNALNGDTTSLIFFLKTQGKRRGYVERQERTGPDGGAIEVRTGKGDLSALTDDELAAYRAIVAKLADSSSGGTPPD